MTTVARVLLLSALVFGFAGLARESAATSLADPVSTIPAGTVITILEELDAPANSEYIILGTRYADSFSNSLFQLVNDPRHLYGFHSYRSYLFETYEQTYGDCIEAHRQYVSVGGYDPSISNQTVVSGRGNTVINNNNFIGNTGGYSAPQTISYIGANDCTPPQYTVALLELSPTNKGRLIARGKTFEVKNAKVRRFGRFNEIRIGLKHKVVRALTIITTHEPDEISIFALDSSRGDGFMQLLGSALTGITDNYTAVALPAPEYID